jgi:hypothetical protein
VQQCSAVRAAAPALALAAALPLSSLPTGGLAEAPMERTTATIGGCLVLLLGVATATAASSTAGSSEGRQHAAAAAATTVDVIIVGGGWAGMAAADSLARANVSFVVLEATNRTGGRSHALPHFGHPSVWSGVVERGSNWVSGVAPPGVVKAGAAGVARGLEHLPWENPVYTLARRVNLSTVRVPGSADGNMSGYAAVYASDGDISGDPHGDIRERANRALDCINSSWARKVPKQSTMREGLRHCGWVPRSEEEYAVDWAMSGEDANGEPARRESLASFDPDASYEWWGPDDRFVIDQHPRGFARMIDSMVQDSVSPTHVKFGAHFLLHLRHTRVCCVCGECGV